MTLFEIIALIILGLAFAVIILLFITFTFGVPHLERQAKIIEHQENKDIKYWYWLEKLGLHDTVELVKYDTVYLHYRHWQYIGPKEKHRYKNV